MRQVMIICLLFFACASQRPLIAVKDNIWMLSTEGASRVVMFEFKAEKQPGYGMSGSNFSFMATNDLWNISVFIEKCRDCNTAPGCRDMILDRIQKNRSYTDIRKDGNDSTAYLECTLRYIEDTEINQRNFYKEFVCDGYWYDIHLSKTNFEDIDSVFAKKLIGNAILAPKNIRSSGR